MDMNRGAIITSTNTNNRPVPQARLRTSSPQRPRTRDDSDGEILRWQRQAPNLARSERERLEREYKLKLGWSVQRRGGNGKAGGEEGAPDLEEGK